MSKLAIVCSLIVASLSPAFAADGSNKILNFTGVVQISVGGKVTTIDASQGSSQALPDGAIVTIVSGEASFQVGGCVVSANPGDSFSMSKGQDGGMQITGLSGAPVISAGDSTAVLTGGNSVEVVGKKDSVVLTVVAGNVTVSGDNGTQTINQGQSTHISTTPGDLKDAPNSGVNPNNNQGNNNNNNSGNGNNGNSGFGGGGSGPNPNQDRHTTVSRSHP